eukprot:7371084-Prymnesium_polylepis.1
MLRRVLCGHGWGRRRGQGPGLSGYCLIVIVHRKAFRKLKGFCWKDFPESRRRSAGKTCQPAKAAAAAAGGTPGCTRPLRARGAAHPGHHGRGHGP